VLLPPSEKRGTDLDTGAKPAVDHMQTTNGAEQEMPTLCIT
jgi:hypothetical protein